MSRIRGWYGKRPWSRTIRGRFALLILVIFLPILAVQILIYHDRYEGKRRGEYMVNIQIAKSLGNSLESYVRDLLHQESILGSLLSSNLPEAYKQRLISHVSGQHATVKSFSWVDPQGRVKASSDPLTIGKEVSNCPAIEQISAGQEWAISPLQASQTTGEPIFTVCRGIRDENGDLTGVVVAAVNPEILGQVLEFKLEDGEFILIDSNGMVVYREPNRIRSWGFRIYSGSSKSLRSALDGSEVASTEKSFNGEEKMTALVPVRTLGWVAAVGRPTRIVLKPIRENLFMTAVLFFSVLFASLLTAIFISGSMASSIRSLQRHSLALGGGNLDVRAQPEGPLEVQDLANGFNAMADSVRARQKEVEEEKHRAEELAVGLAREKAFLSTVLKQMPCGVVIAENPTGNVIQFNSSKAEEIWRGPVESLLKVEDCEKFGVFHPGGKLYGPGEWPLSRSIRDGEVVIDEEIGFLKADGTFGVLNASSSPIYDEVGTLIAGVVTFHDITQRKEMEAELERSRQELEMKVKERTDELAAANQVLRAEIQERERAQNELQERNELLEGIFSNVHFLVAYMDTDFNFKRVNRAFADADGHGPDYFIGRNHFDLYPNDENQATFQRVIETGETFKAYEKPFVYPDRLEGGMTYWDWTLHPVKGLSGRVNGLVMSLIDVTQRKRAQDEVNQYIQDLNKKNRELQEFAYIASHDLQEPLRKIQLFSDLIAGKHLHALDEEALDYFKRMENASSRMQALINGLLQYSRITSKGNPPVSVDLNKVVQEVLSDLEGRMNQEKGAITSETLPTLKADPVQMRQLFQNLIGNALKFHKEGEAPSVRIHAGQSPRSERKAPGTWRIYIEDNGIGFDEKHLERIFVPFERLHGRGKYEGTGIGLAICRKIVERHGGMITAKSEKGKGSTFIVELPLRQPSEAPRKAAAA